MILIDCAIYMVFLSVAKVAVVAVTVVVFVVVVNDESPEVTLSG